MKFIIPQNYKYKNKLFGLIDYPTAIINIVWNLILYYFLRRLFIALTIKIFVFTALSFPVLLLTIIGFNNESPIYTIKYLINYFKKPKIYLFNKNITN